MDYISKSSDENNMWLKSAQDAIHICERRNIPYFMGFLDAYQNQLLQTFLQKENMVRYQFYGGYAEAERTYLGVFPMNREPATNDFPITALAFQYRSGIKLSHRDFLGTLLSCGVKRKKIGDILCSDGFSVAFVDREISRFLASQITKVGGEGVSILENYMGDLPISNSFKEIRDTVASPRLDAAVKVAVGISREEAARRIDTGQVSVNHISCASTAKYVHEKDIVSIRGVGRFIIDKLGPVTKKGRLFISIKKYL